jgi:hypothetical protein
MRRRRSASRLHKGLIRSLRRVRLALQLVDRLEHEFEAETIVRLLKRWGLRHRRQVVCRIRKRGQVCIGRIDFLVHTEDNKALLTLFENKRHIRSVAERERAAAQANDYARAHRLRSFVIAAPEGLWIYSRPGGRPQLEATFSRNEVRAGASQAKDLLIVLHRCSRNDSSARSLQNKQLKGSENA